MSKYNCWSADRGLSSARPRKSIAGVCKSPRAISKRRFMPPENVLTRSSLRSHSSTNFIISSDFCRRFCARHAIEPGVEKHVLIRRQLVIERRVLEDDAKRLSHIVRPPHRIHAVYEQGAGRRMEQGRQHFYGRGLACAIWSKECKYRTRFHFKRNIIDGHEIVVELFGQVFDGNGGCCLVRACR